MSPAESDSIAYQHEISRALIVGASRAAEYASRDPDLQVRAVAVTFDGLRPGTRR